jgi:xanthine dehydrogenase accessory factor
MAADLARREEPFVLAVVVRRRPASSAQAGDMALVTADGDFHGWLGGSCTQPTVIREARRALADGKPRLVALTPDPETERRPGVTVFPMTCHSGGSVEIYLDPILPAPRLAVFGASPTARALVRLGKAMGYTVVAVAMSGDDSPPGTDAGNPQAADNSAVDPKLFPEADVVLSRPDAGEIRPARGGAAGRLLAVVATMGESDEAAIRAALALAPIYLGVVASAKRFAQIRQTLLAQGEVASELDQIRSPAGVDIGAHSPAEIALSVLAEAVERLGTADARGAHASKGAHGSHGSPGSLGSLGSNTASDGESAGGAAEPRAAAPLQAVDPICGMTVEIAGARHTAAYAGRTYYFCCGSCRERFLAAPERFAAPGAA